MGISTCLITHHKKTQNHHCQYFLSHQLSVFSSSSRLEMQICPLEALMRRQEEEGNCWCSEREYNGPSTGEKQQTVNPLISSRDLGLIAFNTIYNLSLKRNCLNLTYFSSIRTRKCTNREKTPSLLKNLINYKEAESLTFFQDVLVETLEVILQLSELFLLLYLNQYCSRSREAKPSTNKHESGGGRGVERGEDFLLCITHLDDTNNLSLINPNLAQHQPYISSCSCEMWLTFISG